MLGRLFGLRKGKVDEDKMSVIECKGCGQNIGDNVYSFSRFSGNFGDIKLCVRCLELHDICRGELNRKKKESVEVEKGNINHGLTVDFVRYLLSINYSVGEYERLQSKVRKYIRENYNVDLLSGSWECVDTDSVNPNGNKELYKLSDEDIKYIEIDSKLVSAISKYIQQSKESLEEKKMRLKVGSKIIGVGSHNKGFVREIVEVRESGYIWVPPETSYCVSSENSGDPYFLNGWEFIVEEEKDSLKVFDVNDEYVDTDSVEYIGTKVNRMCGEMNLLKDMEIITRDEYRDLSERLEDLQYKLKDKERELDLYLDSLKDGTRLQLNSLYGKFGKS